MRLGVPDSWRPSDAELGEMGFKGGGAGLASRARGVAPGERRVTRGYTYSCVAGFGKQARYPTDPTSNL